MNDTDRSKRNLMELMEALVKATLEPDHESAMKIAIEARVRFFPPPPAKDGLQVAGERMCKAISTTGTERVAWLCDAVAYLIAHLEEQKGKGKKG